jgi:hypothetical protein
VGTAGPTGQTGPQGAPGEAGPPGPIPDAGPTDSAPDPTKVILNANAFPDAQAASINISQSLLCGSFIGVGTASPKSGIQVSSNLPTSPLVTDDDSVVIDGRDSTGNARIELRTSPGAGIPGTPYIDFARDTTSDYNARIALTNTTTLSVQGSNLAVPSIIVQGTANVGYELHDCQPTTAGAADCVCPSPNEVVITGGTFASQNVGHFIRESRPIAVNTWRVTCAQSTGSGVSVDVICNKVTIICARLAN